MGSENRAHWKQVLKVFLVTALPLALVIAVFSSISVGLVFGALIGVFAAAHLGRKLEVESFEITTQNKDRQKGFLFYEEEVIRIMRDLRYELVLNTKELKIWEPRLRARVMGGEFKMEVSPYSIKILGPRGMVRIVVSMLDLSKIYL